MEWREPKEPVSGYQVTTAIVVHCQGNLFLHRLEEFEEGQLNKNQVGSRSADGGRSEHPRLAATTEHGAPIVSGLANPDGVDCKGPVPGSKSMNYDPK